ncbi:MAG: hypothetical protein HKN84_15290 [Gammaproteobacteria bacterium]|nr:hypothetical protein [Gammaproteobacteria bacterium]
MTRCLAFAACVVAGATAAAQELGDAIDIFGVYTPPLFRTMPPVTQPDVYPFTPQAQEFFETYNPAVQDARSVDDCAAEKVPGILWDNNLVEFVNEGDTIIMRFERLATTRRIHMDGEPPPADHPRTNLGYSIGRWEDGVLAIETTHTAGGVLRNLRGHPVSPDARLTERYWREPGQMDLRMTLTVEDPLNYSEPVTLGREWVWAPDEELQPWNCVSLGPKDAEPDLDELTRMLESL